MFSLNDRLQKSVRYQLFIDEEDFNALTIKAQQEGYLNLGSYLRDLIKKEIKSPSTSGGSRGFAPTRRGEKRHGN